MTASDQLSRITPYVGRLLEDEYIQEQIVAFAGCVFQVFLIAHQLRKGFDQVSTVPCDNKALGVE